MLQTHLCCILNLWRTTAKQLARSSWSHGTCHTNLTLTAHFSPWYGSVILHYITEQASRCKCVKNLCFREIMSLCKMIKYCRYNATCPTCRCSNNRSAWCILLTHSQSIGINHSTTLQRRFVTTCLNIISCCLTCKIQWTGQSPFTVQSPFNSSLHGVPNLTKIIPEVVIFTLFHILPVATSVMFAPCLYGFQRMKVVYWGGSKVISLCFSFWKSTSTNAIYRPFIRWFSIRTKRTEKHTIRMIRQKDLGFPHNLHWCHLLQYVNDSLIRHVSLSRSSQAAIQSHLKARCFGVSTSENDGCSLWSHRMTAWRSLTYSEYFA